MITTPLRKVSPDSLRSHEVICNIASTLIYSVAGLAGAGAVLHQLGHWPTATAAFLAPVIPKAIDTGMTLLRPMTDAKAASTNIQRITANAALPYAQVAARGLDWLCGTKHYEPTQG